MKATCRRLSLVGLLVILAAATTLGAQSTTGSIQGTVKTTRTASCRARPSPSATWRPTPRERW